jgi:hypothetical protein
MPFTRGNTPRARIFSFLQAPPSLATGWSCTARQLGVGPPDCSGGKIRQGSAQSAAFEISPRRTCGVQPREMPGFRVTGAGRGPALHSGIRPGSGKKSDIGTKNEKGVLTARRPSPTTRHVDDDER